MGLAASQARFLCITARKMNCEYKSTDLAQQKLEITNQLSDISNEYSNAMNATKLIWDNQSVNSTSGVDYALLMSPSAANDYNPYMLSTTSGAIVLNSTYAAAAKAAGISKAGGFGSQDSRDKFLSALCSQGIITEETTKSITNNFYPIDKTATEEVGQIVFAQPTTTNGIAWNTIAGMGDEPKDKYAADDFTLSELCMSKIGTAKVDWAQIIIDPDKDQVTDVEYKAQLENFQDLISSAQQKKFNAQVIGQLNMDYKNFVNKYPDNKTKAEEYQAIALLAQNYNSVDENGYIISNGNPIQYKGNPVTQDEAWNLIVTQLKDDKTEYVNRYQDVKNDDGSITKKRISLTDVQATNDQLGFNTTSNAFDVDKLQTLSVLSNGIVLNGDNVTDVDLADILTGNITLMSSDDVDCDDFIEATTKIFDQIVRQFGYVDGTTVSGIGLNVDEDSAKALSFAYNMIMKRYLNAGRIADTGNDRSKNSAIDNAAFKNAENYNAIGSTSGTPRFYAVSLSNMLSAFLTYYDNGLMGADSNYVVGETVETSEYVTEDASYVYLGKLQEETYSMSEKVADFYDIMYNNIIENGWREDASINDSEYLEQCIKNGTYSMTSLNQLDGYYYQTRYNDTGYMVEVSDENAIARAEAEFNAKKAELTYKEDKIDIKTKQLDAEISSLSTEYETVKNLISKSIEKTFSMFQN